MDWQFALVALVGAGFAAGFGWVSWHRERDAAAHQSDMNDVDERLRQAEISLGHSQKDVARLGKELDYATRSVAHQSQQRQTAEKAAADYIATFRAEQEQRSQDQRQKWRDGWERDAWEARQLAKWRLERHHPLVEALRKAIREASDEWGLTEAERDAALSRVDDEMQADLHSVIDHALDPVTLGKPPPRGRGRPRKDS